MECKIIRIEELKIGGEILSRYTRGRGGVWADSRIFVSAIKIDFAPCEKENDIEARLNKADVLE